MMDDQTLYLLQCWQLCENGLFIIDRSVVYFMLGNNGEVAGQSFTDLYIIILQSGQFCLPCPLFLQSPQALEPTFALVTESHHWTPLLEKQPQPFYVSDDV
jgi:hypothetical protein